GANAGIKKRRGMEWRLLDRRQGAILGVVALPCCFATMEVAIDTFLRPAVEAFDRCLKRLRVEADLAGERLEGAARAHEARILGSVNRRKAVDVARVEDPPGRDMFRL